MGVIDPNPCDCELFCLGSSGSLEKILENLSKTGDMRKIERWHDSKDQHEDRCLSVTHYIFSD